MKKKILLMLLLGGMALMHNLTAQSRIYAHETNKVNQVSTLMKVIGEGSGMNYGCSESHTDAYEGRNWLNTKGCFDAYSLLRRTTITRSNDDDNRNYEYTRKIFVGLKPSSI
jgi:hypothetical protein